MAKDKEKKKGKKGKGENGGEGVDANGHVPRKFTPVPVDEYVIELIKAEPTFTKDKNGEYIKTTFKIVEGEFKNRTVFHNFNIVNDNEQAMEIGMQQIKDFMVCAGVLNLKSMRNFSPLLNIPVHARIAIKPGDEKYEDQNVIKAFVVVEEETKKGKKDKKGKKASKDQEPDPADKKAGKEKKGKDKKGKDKNKAAWD